MHNLFKPDLIIEATSVCDRACIGCYAPNVVSKKSSQDLFISNPSLFLVPENLAQAIADLDLFGKVVSIRGGEPTRNPLLPELLSVLSRQSCNSYLETHGRWILSEEERASLIGALKANKTNVKLSFDSMHGTSIREIETMVTTLRANSIRLSVGITESTQDLFLKSNQELSHLKIDEVYFQNKATSADSLIRPAIGVVSVNGLLKKTLTSKLESLSEGQRGSLVAV